MHLRNREKIDEYYIPEDWYKNRRKGISAMLRVRDEEEFIKPCMLSIKDFFDELVIGLNKCSDRTPQIIKELNYPNVKIFEYPFTLHHNGPGHNQIPENSVHDNAYFYNWVLSKTNYEYVCKWDGDMVALPNLDKKVRKVVFKNKVVQITECNITGDELAYLSEEAPRNTEPRFFRVSKYTFYRQGDVCEYFTHNYGNDVVTIDFPVFLHFKNAKSMKSATKIWPDDWREIEFFQRLRDKRLKGAVYKGMYPEALKEKIIERAIHYAREVEELDYQEEVMRSMGNLLFALRNNGLKGDVVEIGSKLGKTTVFLSRIMETLLPENKLYTIDPYTLEGAQKSLLLEDYNQIYEMYASFISNTKTLTNHTHFKMASSEAEQFIPRDIIFSYIDGEHTYKEVKNDFRILLDRTVDGGIIAIDDYQNSTWPEVGRAYREIVGNRRIKLIQKNVKAAYLRKNPTVFMNIKNQFLKSKRLSPVV